MVLHKRVLLNGLVTISRQKQPTDLIMRTVIQQINNIQLKPIERFKTTARSPEIQHGYV